MKRINIGVYVRIVFVLAMLLMLSSCGYSSRQNELIGQVKKVSHLTPILCGDRVDTDISLGVMRNGVGSMSAQDVWLTVENPDDVKALATANESGELVKITFDEKRTTLCRRNEIVTKVEIVK